MKQYPISKLILIGFTILISIVVALPNIFGENPALQLTSIDTDKSMVDSQSKIREALLEAKIPYKSIVTDKNKAIVKFSSINHQNDAKSELVDKFGKVYFSSLTIAPATPSWLENLGLKPITKGLDLRGGVHLLLQVDINYLIKKIAETNMIEIKGALDSNKIGFTSLKSIKNGGVSVVLKNPEDMGKLKNAVFKILSTLKSSEASDNKVNFIVTDAEINKKKSNAVELNIKTLRTRMNSIGVSEPSITREGADRISVQLPGISNPQDAKDALSSTASLEYYMVDEEATASGKKRFGVKFLNNKDTGGKIAVKRKIIISGNNIVDASTSPSNGRYAVNVVLDSEGASKMGENTRKNLGKRMAVVYIDYKTIQSKDPKTGKLITSTLKEENVISAATINGQFSKKFETTGNFTQLEAQKLARSLRSGALVAPVNVIEERTVGPSAGKENISKGLNSIILGFVLVMVFMGFYYRKFGLVAITALILNVVLIVSLLSLIGATLTLPGIAGVVLTMGMAVDANVLIFERIKEEQRAGKPPLDSITSGFDNAFSTITDASITTLIAAAILFSQGTGPIKGFAVTLAIGILTSMFTAIVVSKFIIYIWLGRKRNIKKLSI